MVLGPWFFLAVLVAVRLALGIQFQSVGSLAPFLIDALDIDYVRLGTLIGLVQFPMMIFALPAGWLNARLGDRTLGLGGLALMTVGGAIMAIASGFGVALSGRLLTGIGGALLGIVLMKLVFDRFSGTNVPVAVGLLLSAWPAGQALGLAVLPGLATAEGWRVAMASTAVFCAMGLVALALVLPGGVQRNAEQLSRLQPGELAPLLAAATVWSLYNAAFAILVGYGPAYLTGTGMTAAEAGVIVSLLTLPIIVLTPLGGMLSRLVARPSLATALLLPAMAAVAFAAPLSPWPAATFLLLGVLMGLPCSLMAAQAGTGLSAQSRAFGLGIALGMLGLATTTVPMLAGWAGDTSELAATPLYVGAACFLGCLAAHLALMAMQARRAVTPA